MYRTELKDLDSLLADWLDSGRRSSKETHDAYRRDVREFARYLGRPVQEATTADLIQFQAYIRNTHASSSTECRKIAALRSFYRHLLLIKEIRDDIALGIQSPKVENEFKSKALSEDEVRMMIDATAPAPLDSL